MKKKSDLRVVTEGLIYLPLIKEFLNILSSDPLRIVFNLQHILCNSYNFDRFLKNKLIFIFSDTSKK